jgi:hypothetical protein
LPLGVRQAGLRHPDPLSGWPGHIEARVLGFEKTRFPRRGQTAFAVPLRFA